MLELIAKKDDGDTAALVFIKNLRLGFLNVSFYQSADVNNVNLRICFSTIVFKLNVKNEQRKTQKITSHRLAFQFFLYEGDIYGLL